MSTHPIEGLMKVAMENIKEMVDVNTIVGDPVETPDGSVIMPISKVGFGFAAGGSEFKSDTETDHLTTTAIHRSDMNNASVAMPFGGGSGGGVSITPIAFLVVSKQGVKVVPLDNQTHIWERLIDSVPQVVDKIQSLMRSGQAAAGMTGMSTAGSTGAAGMTGMNTPGSTGAAGMTGMSTAGSTGAAGMTGMSTAGSTAGASTSPTANLKNDGKNFIV